MGYALLILLSIFLGLGWLNQYVCSAAIISWIVEKEIPLLGEEIKEHLTCVWLRVLRINRSRNDF